MQIIDQNDLAKLFDPCRRYFLQIHKKKKKRFHSVSLGLFIYTYTCICSAQSRNRDNSRIVPDNVEILTLSGEVRIPTWHGSIPELSLRKVGIGTK